MNKILVILLAMLIAPANAQNRCTYNTYSWNTIHRKAVNHKKIDKPYADLSDEEVDSFTGCSVCEQDQRTIEVVPLKPFKVCRVLAPLLKQVIEGLIERGEPVFSITGYRVGKTRGDIDREGNRTGFSNHSFGVAIDLNPEQNGLYDNCISFNASCRLIRGGYWDPAIEGSLKTDGAIVEAIEDSGLKWGGRIAGRQKDFMHFSPSGY